MKSNSELLLDRMKSEPYSSALYSAACDALTEDGDDRRAGWVRRLMELETEKALRRPEVSLTVELSRLRFWLGLRELRIGDFLSYHSDTGSVFPVDRESGAFVVGQVLEAQGDGVICLTGLRTTYPMKVLLAVAN